MKVTDIVISHDEAPYTMLRYVTDGGEEVVVKLDTSSVGDADGHTLLDRARTLLTRAAAFDVASADFSGATTEPALVEQPDRNQPSQTQSLEEDDDNPDQRPDEALPSRKQEKAIRENPARQRGRFGDY
ncbi:hypothetical protein [Nitratireductor sp. ZSWI3]|uniref:hypothetical protein n=1 Tax=Nitratireductor sp. ZSWI3 TaxID=2966359 RepID=UPI00214FE087|nr:hypothetical protein [Nitratireductor sp. ZSWI3]MCR4264665.1 hypothetical protein [Nitratireductor sp. ZSWI3]